MGVERGAVLLVGQRAGGRAREGERPAIRVAVRGVGIIGATGGLIRHLTLDPTKNYQGLGQPVSTMSRDIRPGA